MQLCGGFYLKYFFFLDETGDHGLNYIDKNFPLFLLCGCLIREDRLISIEDAINVFKLKYFRTEKVILHSREIRKCEGAFQILFDLDVKAIFYRELNSILSGHDFLIIASGINKESLIKKYGRSAKDPYTLSLSFIIERLVFFLEKADKAANVEILVEERGKREDQQLLSHFNSITDRGTDYLAPGRIHGKIKRFGSHPKKENITGLQVADLCAYPLARYVLEPESPYQPYEIIKNKIYRNEKGEIEGWGLKVFP